MRRLVTHLFIVLISKARFLEDHHMTPSSPRLWITQFIDSLLETNEDYRSRVVDKVSRQASRLRKLTPPGTFRGRVDAMLQATPERAVAITEVSCVRDGPLHANELVCFRRSGNFTNSVKTG